MNPQSLQGNQDGPQSLGPLARTDMSGHRHSFQNTTSSEIAAVFSNGFPEAPRQISLLDIPPELVTRVLLYLSPHDIISCGRTCRMLHDLCGCPVLRYLVQLERCAVSDDLRPGLGYPERLRILENREKAWATLAFRMSGDISVPFHSTGTYDFTGGALILGTRPPYADDECTFGYSYISLPSLSDSQDQELEWKGFNLETEILDFGLAVHEHDLIAALTACVFLGLFVRPVLDSEEVRRTCTNHLGGMRSWNCVY
jgi:hypothetical protein